MWGWLVTTLALLLAGPLAAQHSTSQVIPEGGDYQPLDDCPADQYRVYSTDGKGASLETHGSGTLRIEQPGAKLLLEFKEGKLSKVTMEKVLWEP